MAQPRILLGGTLALWGVCAAIHRLGNPGIGWTDVSLRVVGHLLTGIGITVGCHRRFTDRAFQTKQWVRRTFSILGSMALEGTGKDMIDDPHVRKAYLGG